jgi:hypothetical protein
MRVPRIFVSSTCYDLRQIREDLKAFIEGLGYEAVLSEYPSFPVHPDKTTIENSMAAVRGNCDVFVLIVGGRYGSVDEATERSITNSEFLEAKAAELPVYAFVLQTVDTLLPAWQANPEISHPAVESTRVFEFIQELKASLIWVFSFETAADITDTLRRQLAYLFTEGLDKRRLLLDDTEIAKLGLRGEALRLAIQKERYWEYRLFRQVMREELDQRNRLKLDRDLRIVTDVTHEFDDVWSFEEWMQLQLAAAQRLIASWNSLVAKTNEAFGEPGQPGDVQLIVYTASRLGSLYQAALEWALEFFRMEVPEDADDLRELSSHFLDEVVESFPRLVEDLSGLLDQALEGTLATGVHELVWTVSIPDEVVNQHSAELDRLHAVYFGPENGRGAVR